MGEATVSVKFKQTCACTEDDYECDLGFYKDQNSHEDLNQCKASYKYKHLINNVKEQCGESDNLQYEFTTGYRKIAGDICFAGVD